MRSPLRVALAVSAPKTHGPRPPNCMLSCHRFGCNVAHVGVLHGPVEGIVRNGLPAGLTQRVVRALGELLEVGDRLRLPVQLEVGFSQCHALAPSGDELSESWVRQYEVMAAMQQEPVGSSVGA